MQSWGNMQTDKFDSHGRARGDAPFSSQNTSASYGTTTPSVLPSQSQPAFPASDSWRAPVPSQSNTQIQAPAWGMNTSQNSGQPQAPTNQNSSWGQGTVVNPNMGWAGGPQTGMVNWAASWFHQLAKLNPKFKLQGVVQALDGCRQVKGCSLGTVIKTGELKTRQQCQVVGQEGTKLVTGETNRARMEILDMVGTGSLVEVVGITTSKGKEYASSIEKMEVVGKEQPAVTSTTKPAFLNLSLSFCFWVMFAAS
ncbi:hypothetical protein Bca52824_031766 [Brassica carinata]|uniref:Uncharacterized protein n=1 Tax=Brassica carinata TaxID=52824 RepID=A0A8X7SCS3_BRACI|nr:hypothetical protein Bca52824_031766 [Brassica carinata]